jgi:hypothetical protein
MLLEFMVHQVLQQGLWCSSIDTCMFDLGGIFITTSVRKLLFEGFSDPSVLKYLSLKHESDNITFICAANAVSACGQSNMLCNEDGILMQLPASKSFLLKYNETAIDEYFSPVFYVDTVTGDMYWPHAMNSTRATLDALALQALNVSDTLSQQDANTDDVRSGSLGATSPSSSNIVRVFNPIWAAHPAWHSGNVPFNKYLQCSKRYFGGPVDVFASCEDTLNTGAVDLFNTLNLQTFSGNSTLRYYSTEFPVNGSTFPDLQNPMYLFKGFASIPYVKFDYISEYETHSQINLFDKKYGHWFPLSQDSLVFAFEKEIAMLFPVRNQFEEAAAPESLSTPLRR